MRTPSKGFIIINLIKKKIIYFLSLCVNYNNRSPSVCNDSQNGMNCRRWATMIYKLTKDIVKDNIVAPFALPPPPRRRQAADDPALSRCRHRRCRRPAPPFVGWLSCCCPPSDFVVIAKKRFL
jgi:hypothetical protein